MTKKKPVPSLRVTLSEVRPNSGTSGAVAPLDLIVSHQSPFPWLNTVTFAAACPGIREDQYPRIRT